MEPVRSLEDYQRLVGRYAYFREPPLLAAVVHVLRIGQINSTPRIEQHPEDFIDVSEDRRRRKERDGCPPLSADAIDVCSLLAAVVQVLRVGPLDSTSRAEAHREAVVDGSADGGRRNEQIASPLVSIEMIEVRFRVAAVHLKHEHFQMQVGQICVVSRKGFSAGCLWRLQQTDRADNPFEVMRAVELDSDVHLFGAWCRRG